jgi:hypothetical protein
MKRIPKDKTHRRLNVNNKENPFITPRNYHYWSKDERESVTRK